jgi:hypothetical protein
MNYKRGRRPWRYSLRGGPAPASRGCGGRLRRAGGAGRRAVPRQHDTGEQRLGAGAFADGQQQVARAVAYLQRQRRVGGGELVEVGQDRAVLGEGRRGLAQVLQALHRLVAEPHRLRGGRAGLGGAFTGRPPAFRQGEGALATARQRGGALLDYDGRYSQWAAGRRRGAPASGSEGTA